MFNYEEDRVKVGSYLKELILKKYESLTAFYREYLTRVKAILKMTCKKLKIVFLRY